MYDGENEFGCTTKDNLKQRAGDLQPEQRVHYDDRSNYSIVPVDIGD